MANTTAIQQQYRRHQQAGQPGWLARPNAPHAYDMGEAGEALNPGDGVRYVAATNDWRKPTSTAERLEVQGIVSYDIAAPSGAITQATGQNASAQVEIADGSPIKVGVIGSFWAIAGGAIEYGDIVLFDQSNSNWVRGSTPGTSLATTPRNPAICVSPSPVASGDIVEIRFAGQIR